MSRGDCGICGLPNVGKSTIFTALTAQQAAIENYPFCTIEPNLGIVTVPEPRLDAIGDILGIKKRIPPVVEFVDIAGLVAGAATGEGLGNQFLSHIREVEMILHVVRCFSDDDVAHVSGAIDPISDIDTIRVELALADIGTVERHIEKNESAAKSSDREAAKRAKNLAPLLESVRDSLSSGVGVIEMDLDEDAMHSLSPLHLLTAKEVLYLCNTGESASEAEVEMAEKVRNHVGEERVLSVSGKLEAEIASIDDEAMREEFLRDAGLDDSGFIRLIHAGYRILGLRTFFTENGEEVRGWTFDDGDTAPVAVGTIHTDFREGFIRADVFRSEDLIEAGSLHALREHGKTRTEGRDYLIQDGDVIKVKFQPPAS